jgi:LysW-gamma-L-alpha-aminoadipyl-6-phosphate/LysW-L-glutamyl-5-phosphate reductase
VVFSCLPHSTLAPQFSKLKHLAKKIFLDCSADFRLKNATDYEKWYKISHPTPAQLTEFVFGLPELHAAKLKKASKIAVAGCTSTAAILALAPLLKAKANLIDATKLIFDLKVGSSGSGNKPSPSNHYSERAGTVRSYKLAGHRHIAEVIQELNLKNPPSYAISSVPTVRGITCHAHAFLTTEVDDKKIWQTFREFYANAPFIRIIKEPTGIHKLPEAKILSGTNFCDLGWVLDKAAKRITIITAIDNLGKGAAGNAIECANLALGLTRNAGLEFLGLHP